MRDELAALLFELQRAPTAADKAKAMARAWRTIRDLKPAERRLLVREVGFDGAEDLIEGLADGGRGAFAPAAVLEALGRMRHDRDLSLRGVLADLRDPDRRDELLVRGMDLVADSVAGSDEDVVDKSEAAADHEDVLELENHGAGFDPQVQAEVHRRAPPAPPVTGQDSLSDLRPDTEGELRLVQHEEAEPEHDSEPGLVSDPPPQPPPVTGGATTDEIGPESAPIDEFVREPEPSVWDGLAQKSRAEALVGMTASAAADATTRESPKSTSAIRRLRQLRADAASLRGSALETTADRLDAFPEPWARRRALVALIEAGVPDTAAAALDLIETLDRPMDRRWCLSALARRGDLMDENLDRALAMLDSPAARRRIAGLAERSAA